MNFSLPEVRSGQPVRADDYNRLVRHVRANTISGTIGILMERTATGVVLRSPRSPAQSVSTPSEFLFINKLSLYYNPTSEAYEIWIYAPAGHPSLMFPGTLNTEAVYGSYFHAAAYVDETLDRDGDWVNTGLGLGSVWAYIEVPSTGDIGTVKFASEESTSWNSGTVSGDGVPNVQIGVTRYTGGAPWTMNYVVGVVGVFSAVNHSAIQFDSEPT